MVTSLQHFQSLIQNSADAASLAGLQIVTHYGVASATRILGYELQHSEWKSNVRVNSNAEIEEGLRDLASVLTSREEYI